MALSPFTAPLPKVFSTSQISTYSTCPRQYCYRYVLKIPTLVTPEAMVVGSRVHAAIAEGAALGDPGEQAMVDAARQVLATYPAGPVFETDFSDPENPGRIWGDVLGERFVGVFDVHWPEGIGVDWKTGKFHARYTDSHETQAFVLSELFAGKYGRPLERMDFHFVKVGAVHHAKAIGPGRAQTAAAERIAAALAGIRERWFEKKTSRLCEYCEHAGVCGIDVGFR
jgi:hypothetical protein